jgi:glucose-1-phosphate thymidylyltransferase
MQASKFIEVIEERQGLKIACPEEIAYRMGYIDAEQVRKLAQPLIQNSYGQYLLDMLQYEGDVA